MTPNIRTLAACAALVSALAGCAQTAPLKIDLDAVQLMPDKVAREILVGARKDPLWRQRISKDTALPSRACYFEEGGVKGILHYADGNQYTGGANIRPYNELRAVVGMFDEIMVTDLRFGQQLPCYISVWTPQRPESSRLANEIVTAMKSLGTRVDQRSSCPSSVDLKLGFVLKECAR